jgi:hypothetical protein
VDGCPFSAFEKAVKVCQEVTPGLMVDMSKPGQVTLQKLKKPLRRIQIVKEPHDLAQNFTEMENCCFCSLPTNYWVPKKDVACCPTCAMTHVLEEVPTKAEWCAKRRETNANRTK